MLTGEPLLENYGNALEKYRRFLVLKFKTDAASRLRAYLRDLKDKLDLREGNTDVLIKRIEALLVFLSKAVALKAERRVISAQELESAISFFEFYSTSRLWGDLAQDQTFTKLEPAENNFITEIKKIYYLEAGPNSKMAVDDILARFAEHVSQLFSSADDAVKQRFLLLVRYTIVILSFLTALSRSEVKLSTEDVNMGYYLFRNLLFRVPVYEFNVLFNLKSFVKREVMFRLLEHMEELDKSTNFSVSLENYVNAIPGLRFDSKGYSPLYGEVKSTILVLFLFKKHRAAGRVSDSKFFEDIIILYKSIILKLSVDMEQPDWKNFYEALSEVELSIDAKLILTELTNRIIRFEGELNLKGDKKYLIADLARKITQTISLVARTIAYRDKRSDCRVSDVKKGLNVVSNVFYYLK